MGIVVHNDDVMMLYVIQIHLWLFLFYTYLFSKEFEYSRYHMQYMNLKLSSHQTADQPPTNADQFFFARSGMIG